MTAVIVPAASTGRLAPPRGRVEKRRPTWLSVPLRFLLPVLIFAGWWIGSATGALSPEVLAGPPKVWSAFTELVHNGQLVDFALASFVRAGLGVGLGVSAGLLLGLAAGLSSLGEELVDSTMQIVRAVPFLALVPLFIAWFGIDELYKVLLIAVATVAPMYAYTYLGVRNVDRKVAEVVLRPEPVVDLRAAAAAARTAAAVVEAAATAAATAKGNANNYQNTTE